MAVIVVGLGYAIWHLNHEERPVAPPMTPVVEESPPSPEEPPPPVQLPTFTLGKITLVDVPDAEAAQKAKLTVPLMVRAGVKISVRDLVIEVRFYDQLANDRVVVTRANVKSKWASPPADWSTEVGETLEVDYTLAKATDAADVAEERKLYGYLVNVYYGDILQAVEAAPRDLAERFPAPQVRESGEAQ